MRFKDVFSIIGPTMVGPSSSHTAGAARIGRAARQVLGEVPRVAEVTFFGSFAATYQSMAQTGLLSEDFWITLPMIIGYPTLWS